MFVNFDELKLEQEMKILDRKIDKLIAINSHLNKILDNVPNDEKFTYELLNDEYWKISGQIKVLMSVQENIEKILD